MTKKAAQYDPAILLKISLFAYSKGITSSREIQWCCETNILCIESERLSDF
ncbi:transposase [Oceanobacter sp. 3_MG-2023]|uniref:transposase n=1 Tax=Oceanobacter sp. 3_MG-2023 TaxID=3062622 RepID=UPI00273279C2|nr:transposase [Oceanobacter sp. 3_MG-2023]MDP2504945.1 transposase [Oceanobacter sp. 3_MG-2023]